MEAVRIYRLKSEVLEVGPTLICKDCDLGVRLNFLILVSKFRLEPYTFVTIKLIKTFKLVIKMVYKFVCQQVGTILQKL